MKQTTCYLLTVLIMSIAACGDSDYDNNGNFVGQTDGREESPCSSSNDFCVGDNICINGLCANAFDRSYDLTIETLRVNERTVNGEAWDGFGGLPDPQVSIYLNGSNTPQCATPGEVDTTTASFFTTCQFQFRAGDGIEIYVRDEDNFDHDVMFICTGTITTDTLRSRGLRCDTAEGTLTIDIQPRG